MTERTSSLELSLEKRAQSALPPTMWKEPAPDSIDLGQLFSLSQLEDNDD